MATEGEPNNSQPVFLDPEVVERQLARKQPFPAGLAKLLFVINFLLEEPEDRPQVNAIIYHFPRGKRPQPGPDDTEPNSDALAA